MNEVKTASMMGYRVRKKLVSCHLNIYFELVLLGLKCVSLPSKKIKKKP